MVPPLKPRGTRSFVGALLLPWLCLAACGHSPQQAPLAPTGSVAVKSGERPPGYPILVAALVVEDIDQAVDFYTEALSATLGQVFSNRSGEKQIAELFLGDGTVLLQRSPLTWASTPASLNGTSASLYIYVDDVDAAFSQAIQSGGTTLFPVRNRFWGDRFGAFVDPFGHQWGLAQKVVDLSPKELQAASLAAFQEDSQKRIKKILDKATKIRGDYRTNISPALVVLDTSRAIQEQVDFGGESPMALPFPLGLPEEMASDPESQAILHGEVMVGDTVAMFTDEIVEYRTTTPITLGGTTMLLYRFVENLKATCTLAANLGLTVSPIKRTVPGFRLCDAKDESGHIWRFATWTKPLPKPPTPPRP